MGNKVNNYKPQQSLDSLVVAFDGALTTNKGKYLIAEKEKGEHEIDGIMRDDVWCLDRKGADNGVRAAAYRLSGRRAEDYKEARVLLDALVTRAVEEGVIDSGHKSVVGINEILQRSSSKRRIKINEISAHVNIIIEASKTKVQKYAEAVQKDIFVENNEIFHFIDDVATLKLQSDPGPRDSAFKRADERGSGTLLRDIDAINRQAATLLLKLGAKTADRLKLAKPSFTTSKKAERATPILGICLKKFPIGQRLISKLR